MALTISAPGVTTEYSVRNQKSTSAKNSTIYASKPANKTPEKEAAGKKSEAWQTRFRQQMKDDYQITAGTVYSYSLGKNVKVYNITAKKDVNLAKLKSDLGIKEGVISASNDGYGQYDDDGHYIDNKKMKGVTIHIPMDKLGETIDERSFIDKVKDFFGI